MSDWPRVVNEAVGGDPFVKIIECDGKRYRFDEAAMIQAEEENYCAIEESFRSALRLWWASPWEPWPPIT